MCYYVQTIFLSSCAVFKIYVIFIYNSFSRFKTTIMYCANTKCVIQGFLFFFFLKQIDAFNS